MRVLIGCEFSGRVRREFRALGHEAYSCDLLPAEDNGEHIQGDIFKHLNDGWDLLIFHWPCTRLCNSGVRWLYGGKGKVIDAERWRLMEQDAKAFRAILNCGIPRICGENPIPHKYAREIMGNYSQIIQPYQFGHPESKATCLWLKNLDFLRPTQIVEGRYGRVWREGPSPDRWKNRSRTYEGIAQAMAQQWGKNLRLNATKADSV